MRKNQCKLKIFIHNYYEDGTEGDETHFISYYKKPTNFKGNHKKTKSVNLQNKEININSILPKNNNNNSMNNNKNNNNQNFKKKKSSTSKNKNSNNTTSYIHKDSYPDSMKTVSVNKFSNTYNNNINYDIYNNNNNLNNSQNFNNTIKMKKEMLNNKNLSRSKSPNIKKIIINQPLKTEDEKVSIQINDIILIKEKINDLIREESELEKQKFDITEHFEFKLKPIRELNQQLIIENKIIIDKEDELSGQLALLKNQYSQLIIQLNEKNDIINGLNSTYEKEKGYFDKQINEEEENLNNIYNQAIEDLNNGKQIEIDDILP